MPSTKKEQIALIMLLIGHTYLTHI